jgi:hypothetical protein
MADSEADSEDELVLRKAREEWRFAAIAVLVVFGLPFVAAAVAAGAAGEWGIVAIVGPLVLGPTIAIWGHLRYSRIVVTPDEIVVRGFVARRRVPRAPAARVVRANVVQPRAGIVDMVFVLDAAGGLLVRIYGRHYRRADIDRLVAFLGLPSVVPDGLVTANQLSTLYPGIVPWYEAHPVRLGLYAAAGAAVGIMAAGVILSVLASPL